MSPNKALVFDIQAQYGSFQAAEATRAPVSFPFTRTALVGLIGAMIGRERNSYWGLDDSLGNVQLGLEVVNPIIHVGLMVNYTHTRDVITMGRGNSRFKTFLSQAPGKRGYVTAVRLDLLYEVHYRIYLHSDDEMFQGNLTKAVRESLFVYPPYLGHANLLADVVYKGEYPMKSLGAETGEVNSVVAASQVDPVFLSKIDSRSTLILGIPIRMRATTNAPYKLLGPVSANFLINEKGGEQGLPIQTSNSNIIYSIDCPDGPKQICFMPDGRDLLDNEGSERIFKFGEDLDDE